MVPAPQRHGMVKPRAKSAVVMLEIQRKEAGKLKKKDYVVIAISIIVGVCIKLLWAPTNGLTASGVSLLAVFIPTIILWLFCDTGWTSLLSCVALAFMLVADGDTVFMTMWGNNVCVRVISLSIMATVMTEGGATQWIAKWFISRRAVHGRPYVFLFFTGIVGVLLGFVVSPPIIVLLFISLNESVALSIGYSRKDKFYKASMFVSLWCACWSDVISPFGRTVSTTVIALMESYGYSIPPFQWLSFSVPFAILGIFCQLIIIKYVYRPDCSNFVNFDDAAIRKELVDAPMTKQGKLGVVCVLSCVVLWMLPSLSFLPEWVTMYFRTIGTGASVNLMVLILCLVPIDGKPVIDLGKALAKVPWKLIVFVGAIIFFSSYMGSDAYGIKTYLINVLGPVAQNVPVFTLSILGLILTIIATNFMSNTVTASVAVSVFIPVIALYDGLPEKFIIFTAIAIATLADSACCTLAGSVCAGVALNDSVIPYKESLKPCITFSVLLTIVTIGMLMLWGYLL